MLSILIPVYNQAVTGLVRSILEQSESEGIVCEIRCYDDGSNLQHKMSNHSLLSSKQVIYKELPQNLGRSAIRHKLATEARYDKLIFLDGDSGICRSAFLSDYMKEVKHPVVIGGRKYVDKKLPQPHILHWTYGIQRESLSLARRQANPAIYFHSNNFMIDKDLFLSMKFDQGLKGYGYEDLLFAYLLQNENIPIKHIDNPTVHLQLDETDSFLEKTKNGLKNLKQLNKSGIFLGTRLERTADRLKATKLSGIAKQVLNLRMNSIERNLRSDNPRMRLLDYYKLYHFLKEE